MKVKIIALVLVVAVAFSLLVGCDVISKNEQRDIEQVVATVEYKGMTSKVTKGEVIENYNSYGYFYVNYYGYTVDETIDLILSSLTNRKLLILYARYEMATQKGLSPDVEIPMLLTDAEVDQAIQDTNEQMQSWLDEIVSDLEEAANTGDDTDTDTDEDEDEDEDEDDDEITPRAKRPAEEEADFDPNATVEEFTKKFFDVEHNESEYSAKAARKLKKQIAENYRSYEYYLNSQYETQLLSAWKRALTKDYKPTDADILKAYNDYLNSDREKYQTDTTSYATRMKSELTKMVLQPDEGYGFVFNILLQFSDEQSTALSDFKASGTVSDEAIENYRKLLAKEILVNVSNPDYDPDYEAEEGEDITAADSPANPFSRKNVPVQTILDEIFADFQAAEATEGTAYDKFMAKREVATKWVYLVNDDTGMFTATSDDENYSTITNSGNGYPITPEDMDSTYVEEFTKLGRELVAKGLGTYSVDGTVEGMYCITDYGIHIMFVSYIPYDTSAFGLDGSALTVSDNVIPLDYIVSYGRYGSEIEVSQTLRDVIEQSLIDSYTTDIYSLRTNAAVTDNKDSITKNQKIIDKILKEIG